MRTQKIPFPIWFSNFWLNYKKKLFVFSAFACWLLKSKMTKNYHTNHINFEMTSWKYQILWRIFNLYIFISFNVQCNNFIHYNWSELYIFPKQNFDFYKKWWCLPLKWIEFAFVNARLTKISLNLAKIC